MLDTHIARNSLFLTVVCVITLLNGAVQVSGRCCLLCTISTLLRHNRPANKEELFNLRHASARNVIERIFGVVKRRFRILLVAPEYDLEIQARIPAAACALHNFIRRHDPEDTELYDIDNAADDHQDTYAGPPEVQQTAAAELREVTARRDQIAEAMWTDYQKILVQRGLMSDDDDDEGDEEFLDDEELEDV